jgi:archaellum component FlaF (FlaF/FlaG flagellin family)
MIGSRRGISSIVGAMIFLILMTSGISVYFLSIQSQTELIDTQQKVADAEIRKIQEKYAVSATTDSDDANRLAIQVKNEGSFPLEIADIWIINKTDVVNGYPATRHLLNSTDIFIPTGYGKNILENKPLYMNPDEYDVKIISTLGTIRTVDLDVSGNNDLLVELFAIPPDVEINENVTIAMRVTNIGDIDIENVIPYGPPIVNPPSTVVSSEIVSPPSIDLLKPTETGFFTWHYTMNGPINSKVEFLNNASGTVLGSFTVNSNDDTDKITIRDDGTGGGDLIILSQELLARPEIFIVSPSPFGGNAASDTDKAIWGVNVVNPVNATMNVTKVTISGFAPGANNNDQIFASPCAAEGISPTVDSQWGCPIENQVIWKNLSDPIIIPAYSAFSFLTLAEPGTAGSPELESVIVQASVFTSLGTFGKSGYESSMTEEDANVNVYLASKKDTKDKTKINATRLGIPENSEQKFNIVLADMDDESNTHIKSGAKLIINVPRDWTDVKIHDNSGFSTPTINPIGDSSYQIIAATSGSTGGTTETRTISFNATAPDVSNKQMYVMYVLAEGVADTGGSDFAIGPLAEIVLQVIP